MIAATALADCSAACSKATCNTTKCGAANPYACIAGPAAGGCANSPNSWNNPGVCTACCDVLACTAPFTCTAPCTKAQCAAAFPRCPSAAPYQCTSGPSLHGCSNNVSFWPTIDTCTGCCDDRTCEFKCEPCTAAQCDATSCTDRAPYACLSGADNGACSSAADYWWTQSGCQSCCDASACPRSKHMRVN